MTGSQEVSSQTSATKWNGRRCLVTGAGGFIGTALCRELVRRGADVHASGRNAPATPTSYAWTSCDVGDVDGVRQLFRAARPDVVFHLASKVTGARSLDLVLPTLRDTLVGTVNTLTAAAEAGSHRVICLGSLQEPDEAIPAIPNSPYAAAKFAAGAYGRLFAEVYGLKVSVGRPFMVYGAGQLDFTKVVPHILSRLLRGEPAELSSGRAAFDWVYVDDVADALIALAASDAGAERNVDIGCGVLTSVRDIAEGLARRLDALPLLKLGALPDRKGEPTRLADVEKTAGLIGWRARVGVEEGLDRTAEWYRAHFHTVRPG